MQLRRLATELTWKNMPRQTLAAISQIIETAGRIGKRRIQDASNKLRIGATKSRLNISVEANRDVKPAYILFHKLHLSKTREEARVPILFTRCAASYC